MNIRRILISEQEKKEILNMYGDKSVISEQTINQDGTYTTKNTYKFIPTGDPSDNPKFNPTFKAGTKIWTNFDKPNEDKIYFGTADYYLQCSFNGYDSVILHKEGNPLKENNAKPVLTSTVRKLFCNGKKGKKTWKEVTGVVNPQKDTTTKKCYTTDFTPTYAQICKLPNDTTWMYAKDDSDKWYTSKQTDTKKWCELVLPQYQKAVDTLIKGCPTTIEPIKLSIKPIDTTVQPSQSEIQSNPQLKVKTPQEVIQQNLNTANKGREYLQSIQNKPV
jgi:hypothetical protein